MDNDAGRLPIEVRQEFLEALERRGAILPCQRCGHTTWSLLEHFFYLPAQANLSAIRLTGTGLALVGLACTRCAHVVFHAATRLGIDLPADE